MENVTRTQVITKYTRPLTRLFIPYEDNGIGHLRPMACTFIAKRVRIVLFRDDLFSYRKEDLRLCLWCSSLLQITSWISFDIISQIQRTVMLTYLYVYCKKIHIISETVAEDK